MLRGQKGQALLLVLILTTVIFMIGSAAVVMGTAAQKSAIQEVWQKKAYYIAEAGVEMALANLRQRLIYPAPKFEEFHIANRGYAGGIIENVAVTKEMAGSDIFYTIYSSAHYPANGETRARKSIRVKVKVVPDPFLSYGGPGLKSDTAVYLTGGVTSTGGSILARTRDVKSQALIAGNMGGIYTGMSAYLEGGITSGGGEIKAGEDVHLSGALSTWRGEIWAGGEVYGPWWQLGKVTIHEHCGTNIPGFPLPKFPVVDKGSPWYSQVKREAINHGQFFSSSEEFLSHPDKGIKWNYDVSVLFNLVTVWVWGADLNLDGLYVVDGPMDFNQAYQRAYQIWQQRIKDQYPGKQVIFIDVSLGRLAVKTAQPVTIVADSIQVDQGVLGIGGVDTSGVVKPFGLFAVAGDVVYRAVIGTDGRLSVIATGKFDCATSGNLNLDWVAAKSDVTINAIINLNAAQAAVPPGTPVGYQILAWE